VFHAYAFALNTIKNTTEMVNLFFFIMIALIFADKIRGIQR